MIHAALFDAVGTLIELREPVGETYARYARLHGVQVAAAAVQPAFAAALRAAPPMVFASPARTALREAERAWWRAVVWSAFERAGAASQFADFERCFAELFALYAGGDAWRCADGAADVLLALRRRGLRTGMVSNFDHRLPALLQTLGVAALLDVIVLPADAGAAKPDPRIFALALARLGVRADEAVYIGDDAEQDVAGAQRAGLRTIDVTALPDLRAIEGCLEGGAPSPPGAEG